MCRREWNGRHLGLASIKIVNGLQRSLKINVVKDKKNVEASWILDETTFSFVPPNKFILAFIFLNKRLEKLEI